MRAKIRRLQRALRGHLEAIPQRDGTIYYFDRMDGFKETFGYLFESMRADGSAEPRPDPPPILVAVANAKDRKGALETVLSNYNNLPVDPEALVERGEFIPVSLVAGVSYEELIARGGVPDLSEPGPSE